MTKNKGKKEEVMAEGYEGEGVAVEEVKEEKKSKKLNKAFAGSIVMLTEGVTGTTLEFDFNTLPAAIQEKFGPFGLGHKLGDSAAGKSGQEAINSINKVWEGLMNGDWSVRAPATEKISKTEMKSRLDGLGEDEKAMAMALLAKLGVKI
jgi:hypothetical protein